MTTTAPFYTIPNPAARQDVTDPLHDDLPAGIYTDVVLRGEGLRLLGMEPGDYEVVYAAVEWREDQKAPADAIIIEGRAGYGIPRRAMRFGFFT